MLNIRIMPPITEGMTYDQMANETGRYIRGEIPVSAWNEIYDAYFEGLYTASPAECIHGVSTTEECRDCMGQIEAHFGIRTVSAEEAEDVMDWGLCVHGNFIREQCPQCEEELREFGFIG